VEVSRIADPVDFLLAAEPLLLEDEARHNLILGLAATLRDQPSVYEDYKLWLVQDADNVVGAALRTPPHHLVLAQPRDAAAVGALAEAIDEELPGVVGALPEGDEFARSWSAKTGVAARKVRAQGVFALERVQPVPPTSGRLRAATPDDRPLLMHWLGAFRDEALPEAPPDEEQVARAIDHRLASSDAGFVLWEDGEVASMAGFGGLTPNGIRVGPVYTPPALRGRGYATALVAQLSADLLARGRRFCFLYTDLANPTSNRIYERIGYERVCESAEIEFKLAQAQASQ
jgi:predicted GNAT family acetyltransferase